MTKTETVDPLELPKGVDRWRIQWPIAVSLAGVHLLALAAMVPWLFSWTGLIMTVAGLYVFGTLGINVCYHRLLTHRSFTCPRWLERLLTLLAFCNLQGSSIQWIAAHRMHHQHSDDQPDPHSPLIDFIWSHAGWLVVNNPGVHSPSAVNRYAADLCRDQFHLRLEQKSSWLWVWLAHVLLFFAAGMAIGWGLTGQSISGIQLGLSWVVWGVMLRMVLVWHITWAINSVTHLWGYRNYDTPDNSRNNWLFGILSMGEGWHNNHHADQRSAAHGHRWWELDVTFLTIRILKWLGLASNIILPSRRAGTQLDLDHKAIQKPAGAADGGPTVRGMA